MTQNNADASAISEGEMTANALLEALGTTLEPDLLVEALTHRSFSHENPGAKNYERLEFLGDAVLELVSTETLYKAHPDMNEGQLAKMRAKAVSEESLSKIAREKLNAGPYILLGHGESDQGGADKSSILCDIVESLIGATFIQHGLQDVDGTAEVVQRVLVALQSGVLDPQADACEDLAVVLKGGADHPQQGIDHDEAHQDQDEVLEKRRDGVRSFHSHTVTPYLSSE